MSDDPPAESLDIAAAAIPGMGRAVVALPCTNPSLSPTLNVTSHGELGYYLTISDGFGTRIWERRLTPRDT